MATTFATALTDLDTVLNDSANTTFSTGQKTRAMTKAWNDSYVVNPVWDTSLTYTQGTYRYTLPATLTTVKDIYISPTGSTQPMPEPLDNTLWEVVNGYIQFNQRADNTIPSTYTLYLKGHYKLTTSDSIQTNSMYEYVLALAGLETLKLLAYMKANLFVKNDVSMAEIIGLRNDFRRDVDSYRRMLPRQYQSG